MMRLDEVEIETLRKLCLWAIEQAKAQGAVGQAYVLPLAIPFPGEPFDRRVELRVAAAREDQGRS
jgi:hypothetical protein